MNTTMQVGGSTTVGAGIGALMMNSAGSAGGRLSGVGAIAGGASAFVSSAITASGGDATTGVIAGMGTGALTALTASKLLNGSVGNPSVRNATIAVGAIIGLISSGVTGLIFD